MGSASEDEDDDDPHVRGPLLGLGGLGPNGPDSVGPVLPSDLSVQSMSTDSKTTHDDSDQVCIKNVTTKSSIIKKNLEHFLRM